MGILHPALGEESSHNDESHRLCLRGRFGSR